MRVAFAAAGLPKSLNIPLKTKHPGQTRGILFLIKTTSENSTITDDIYFTWMVFANRCACSFLGMVICKIPLV